MQSGCRIGGKTEGFNAKERPKAPFKLQKNMCFLVSEGVALRQGRPQVLRNRVERCTRLRRECL